MHYFYDDGADDDVDDDDDDGDDICQICGKICLQITICQFLLALSASIFFVSFLSAYVLFNQPNCNLSNFCGMIANDRHNTAIYNLFLFFSCFYIFRMQRNSLHVFKFLTAVVKKGKLLYASGSRGNRRFFFLSLSLSNSSTFAR